MRYNCRIWHVVQCTRGSIAGGTFGESTNWLTQREKKVDAHSTMLAFPSSAESVDSWLDAINMARYKPVFEKAGITQVAQLCCLTDEQVQAAGVALVGHRKRLLQAMKELTPPAQGAPLPDSPRRAPRARA